MLARQRLKLRFGPYKTPKFRYGARVIDEIRGEVEIVGLHDGPISWPIGKRGRWSALILYGDLAKAVRHEANIVVQHWWGVKHATVRKWRRALGVGHTTGGSSQLRREHFNEPWGRRARKLAVAKARDPQRRAKIAASRRGKPRPAHVLAALREANAEHAWSAEEDALCRTLRPSEVVQRTGRTLCAVYERRRVLGLPDGRRRESKATANVSSE